MKITRNELRAIRPLAGDQKKMSAMTGILRRHWCPFAALWDQCDGLCSENEFCAGNLGEVIDGIRPDARRWQAVMMFRIREQRAVLKEQLERPELQTNPWGEVQTGYDLEALSRELGVSL
jgi:hypothetical protein